jgi:hypothetical protein
VGIAAALYAARKGRQVGCPTTTSVRSRRCRGCSATLGSGWSSSTAGVTGWTRRSGGTAFSGRWPSRMFRGRCLKACWASSRRLRRGAGRCCWGRRRRRGCCGRFACVGRGVRSRWRGGYSLTGVMRGTWRRPRGFRFAWGGSRRASTVSDSPGTSTFRMAGFSMGARARETARFSATTFAW